jgi:hypothetical protein
MGWNKRKTRQNFSRPFYCVPYALAIGIVALQSTAAKADDPFAQKPPAGFVIQPAITQSGMWDPNPLLLLSGAQQLYGSITSPELTVTDNTPTKQLSSDNKVDENIFNLSNFDSTDFHSKDSFNAQSRSWEVGLAGQIDYDTTRTSELSDFGLQQTVPVRHLGFIATPQISYKVNPTDKLGLTGSVQTSTYANSAFTDFDVFTIAPNYAHNFDPLNTGLFQFSAQQYQATQGPRNVSDTVGPSLGWIGTLTPRLSANANIGVQMTRQDQAGAPSIPWKFNYNFSGELIFKGEQDRIHLTATRSEYPFGNGTNALLTSFSATDAHDVNSLVTLNAGASYEFADYQAAAAGNLESLAGANGGLTYHCTNHLDILGTYQYRIETLTSTSKSVDDHSVTFSLIYHPQPWTL